MTVARSDATGQGDLDPRILEFTTSLPVDQALYAADIAGSLAHVRMLEDCKILSSGDATTIRRGLVSIYEDAAAATAFPWPREEDIHMAIEAELARRIGEVAGRLHTARSRNDQVALDARLFLREQSAQLLAQTAATLDALVDRARGQEGRWLLPAYTHRQRAQPVTVAYLLSAYGQMLARDARRFSEVLEALDECPLGVGAVSGTSLSTDRGRTAAYLLFSRLTRNGLDTVGDRDFALDFTYACARTLLHLSRVSQDMVDFSSQEFGFVRLEDSISCGSSMMPQKKNPDVFELLRGKSSRALGNLTALFATLKGLPVGYMRDLQEDKSYIETAALARSCLDAFIVGLQGVRFVPERMEAALADGMTLATDLAERMVAGAPPSATLTAPWASRCGRRWRAVPPSAPRPAPPSPRAARWTRRRSRAAPRPPPPTPSSRRSRTWPAPPATAPPACPGCGRCWTRWGEGSRRLSNPRRSARRTAGTRRSGPRC